MITNVFIIRKEDKFFALDPKTGNYTWSSNLDDATIYPTADKANEIIYQKQIDAYSYEIPYSVAQPEQRKKKVTKKIKRVIKNKKKRK